MRRRTNDPDGDRGPLARDVSDRGLGDPDEPGSSQDRSRRGLDWFTFFIANLQTGFGPFVSVYLTSIKWTQIDIGFVLTIGGLVGLVGQIPGGALVDTARSKHLIAAVSVFLIAISAVLLGIGSLFPVILFAWLLHAGASCILQPAIVSISLGLVGHTGMARRLGRNASFASVGAALAAAGMGACGYYISNRAVFFVTAALLVPALFALFRIAPRDVDLPVRREEGSAPEAPARKESKAVGLRDLVTDRTLSIFTLCIVLFHLANAAMLPLLGSALTLRSDMAPSLLIAACIIVPQIMVALLSPAVGAAAETWGRRPLLIIGFAALPIRAVCFSLFGDPHWLVLAQALDGVSAAILGVLVPLVIADATRRIGRFALAQGVVGTGIGLGASFSTTFGGFLADGWGSRVAFAGLACVGSMALVVAIFTMPETQGRRSRKLSN